MRLPDITNVVIDRPTASLRVPKDYSDRPRGANAFDPPATVDAILTLQLLAAWAGEGARLGWWRTNLVDPDAGLDLLTRLAPRTAEVAAWELVRAAAIAKRRAQQAHGDRLITLFSPGVDVDEALADRLQGSNVGAHV